MISYTLNLQKIDFKAHFNVVSHCALYFFAAKTEKNHPLISKAQNQHNRGLRDEFTCLGNSYP